VREKIQKPEKIASPFKKRVFTALKNLGAEGLLPIALPVVHLFTDSLVYILKKEA
jgi:hypothetical protein